MRLPVVRSPAAVADLDGIVDYLSASSVDAALRVIDDVEAAFAQLSLQPRLGAVYEFNDPRLIDVRIWSLRHFKNYLIFYVPREDGILVLRILHAARDWQQIVADQP